MVVISVAESNRDTVPRSPEEPTPDQVYDEMVPGRCYVVADLEARFEASRWTVRDRLETLDKMDRIDKQDHENRTVTYQRPHDS